MANIIRSPIYMASRHIQKAITLILNSQDCIKLISPNTISGLSQNQVLLGGDYIISGEKISLQPHIFDHVYTINTTTEKKVFICVDCEVDRFNTKDKTYDFSLKVYVFTEKNNNILNSTTLPTKVEMNSLGYIGNRINMLCDAIDRLICNNNSFGLGEVQPHPSSHLRIYFPNENHYGKIINYRIMGYNEDEQC